jgi:hypothetical protein
VMTPAIADRGGRRRRATMSGVGGGGGLERRDLDAGSRVQDRPTMMVLRLLYTAAVMVVVIWLLRSGDPVGGLLIVPVAAVWLRREAESGRLAVRARRALRR